MQTGVYNGWIMFPSAWVQFKLYEIGKFYTETGFGAIPWHGLTNSKARFDYVLAMDGHNLQTLLRLCLDTLRSRVKLYGDLHADYAGQDVPDPYYGGAAGFERVLDMVEAISVGLLEQTRAEGA